MTRSNRRDPLSDRFKEGADRLNYALGVMLDERDFRDEQTYHRGRLARALKYLFGTGTVAGLRVDFDPTTKEIFVAPGLALDPLGRAVEIPRPKCLVLKDWYEARVADDLQHLTDAFVASESGVIVDVFVRFLVGERGKTQAFPSGGLDATDAVTHARLRDEAEVLLVARHDLALTGVSLATITPNAAADFASLFAAPDVGAMQQRILDGWRDGSETWDEPAGGASAPKPLKEHAPGVDTSAVLLARLTIPADPNDIATYQDQTPDVDNDVRRFVYAPGVLTHY